ncbi:MAG: protein translocase subunit SecF [Caldilineales bacterium]|nr:protein translocase subunit SecF [Caldilineales bacterium]MDW8318479.1 protein translocase subunit SecF [Anaerolineae bacterium]
MYQIVQHRKWYYVLSALVIIPGLIAMLYLLFTTGSPLRLSIDFTGGVYWEFKLGQPAQPAEVRQVFVDRGLLDTSVTTVGNEGNRFQARLKEVAQDTKEALQADLAARFGSVETLEYRNVGPAVGAEVTQAAFIAVFVAAIAILVFLVIAFRNVPHPVRYGACAIAAMVHDILVVTGFMAIMGILFRWEVDALFLTALLTVIGFSVQDTIVVFDRIRENTARRRNEDFETIANRSLLETLHRSLVTQLNAMFILVALLLFGGVTIRQFVAVLLVGMLSGTYSSIFNAVPLLVSWETGAFRRLFGGRSQRPATA